MCLPSQCMDSLKGCTITLRVSDMLSVVIVFTCQMDRVTRSTVVEYRHATKYKEMKSSCKDT